MRKIYHLLLAFLLITNTHLFGQVVPSYVPTNGLVGWWGFNGNAQDGSGNGNHGTVNGATLTTDRFGNQNSAFNFDGVDDWIQVDDHATLRPNHITISAWIYVNTPTINPIVTKTRIGNPFGPDGGEQYCIFQSPYNYQNTAGSFQIKRNGGCQNGGVGWYRIFQTNLPFSTGQWQHIVGTYDGDTMKLYNNGLLSGFQVPPSGPIDNCSNGTFNIGRGWVNYDFYNGKMDNLGMWNRALTPQEITNLYNSQLTTQTSLCLPTITTSSPSSAGVDTVVIGGDISNDGGSSIVLRGICYSTSTNPNMGDQRTEDGSGTGSFNTVLRGLTSSTTYYARSYAKNSNGVVVYGNEVSFTTSVSLPGVRCPGTPTVTDIDGNIYNTVQIGNQCWTQSNLKTSRYRNGDNIPTGLTNSAWGNTTSGAYGIYNNDTSVVPLYGLHYNGYAVNDVRGICPAGWQVPTDNDLTTLVNFLGGDSIAGGHLKSVNVGFSQPNSGASNSSGFSGVAAGYFGPIGGNTDLWVNSYVWSRNSANSNLAWVRYLHYLNTRVYRFQYGMTWGFSVRCLKNTLPQVNTTSVTNVTPSTALVTGEVISDGGDQNTTRGFCYSTTSNPTISNDTTMNGTGLGVYTGTLMNLSPSTTYNVRAYATNSVGTSYGSELSLTTSSISIGSSFAGGIVFYVDGTGQHGLVCAPSDQGSYVWGCDQQFIGGTSSLIGFGLSNTNRINLLCSQNQIASRICADLNLNNYSDWYLPSFNELMEIFWNLQGTNGFSNNFYWSSTEDGQGYAKCMYFSHGFAGSTSNAKFVSQRVRAIRSF